MPQVSKVLVVISTTLVVLSGCSSMKPEKFASFQPQLVLEEYFLGNTKATGLFEDRFGNIRRQFVVDITGTIDGDTLVLDEQFKYRDGETDQRVWRITRSETGYYEGTAEDVIGVAEGQASGNVVRWKYDTKITVNGSEWTVHFDDWMLLQQNGVLMNRATVSRYGLKIGTVLIAFNKN